MESCDCVDTQWQDEVLLVQYQYLSDILIAIAYFAIPLQLIYFVKKLAFFPYRWVLVQFGAFIVLCGTTHFINLWTSSVHTKTVAILMTVTKMSTAAVSCVTAVRLVYIIPDLLSVKTREMFLRHKAEELDKEKGLILTQEETERRVRMLIHEIRSTVDRHTILKTTLVELGRTLNLEECAIWMPSQTGMTMRLTHALNHSMVVGSTVLMNDSFIDEIFNTSSAVRIPYSCSLVRSMPVVAGRYGAPEIVAVRVPLRHHSNFQINDWPDISAKNYAAIVLISRSDSVRKFRDHELELVEVVADQVAVALSHAAALEESVRARNQLMEQNVALDLARREAEMDICARNDFLSSVMNHEMRIPIHAIIALSSILLQTELTPEQRVMLEIILKSSNLLSTLINDVLDLSRLEDGSLELDTVVFNLHGVFKEVLHLIKPIASVKKLSLTLVLAPEMPVCAVGDEKRLLQTMLNVVGNAVKFTKEGYVSVSASVARPESLTNWRGPEVHPVLSDGYFYLIVQVKDSGCGVNPQDMPIIFNKFTQFNQNTAGIGLGLAICKRFVNLMGGQIWIESEGPGKGTTTTFMVKLGDMQKLKRQIKSSGCGASKSREFRVHQQQTILPRR